MLLTAGLVSQDNALKHGDTALRLVVAACLACCTGRALGEQFPYTAYVNAADVYLRSGPGENYYPVAKLDRGQQVEVYRHDPGGWYAVRPPADSFSWVAAEFIEPRQGNLGIVTGDRVVARVGSSFSDTRDVIQVRLERGEEVEILEAHEFNSGPAAQTWYKISPPAGEFRWLSGRYLDREMAEPESSEPSPEHNLLIARQNQHRTRTAIDRPRASEADAGADEPPDDWEDADDEGVRQAAHVEPPRKTKGKHSKPRPKPLPDEDNDEDDESAADEEDRPVRLRPEERVPKANLKEEAADLDLTLSAMVAKEPTEWDFTILRRQAERALDRAQTALDRGRIRRVLRKIDNFSDNQQRYLAVMDSPGGSRSTSLAAADRTRPAGGLSPLRYDGVGRLTQLATIDPRVPQFALIDASGKLAAYVSPAPGVNLRQYLNQEVGINGTLGYLPERQAQHLTAKRIVPVDRGLLR
jgi:hypothetical protein